jgi:phosphonate transport system permease protein
MTQATTGPVTVARPRRVRWQYAVMLGLLVLVVWSYRDTGLSFGTLLGAEGRRQMALFVRQMFPPDLSPGLLRQIAWGALETLAISFLGTLLAVMLAAILLGGATRTVAASRAFSEAGAYGRWGRLRQMLRYGMARALLNLFRSVPELIWALLFILVVGLGPFAGVLALGVHTAGVLGRLFAAVLENVDRRPCETLQAAGANRIQVFLYGMLPQSLPELVSFTLYRWEVNIRAAAILGFVGAGGLGYHLFIALNLFLHKQLLTLMAAMLVLVTCVDLCSALLRRLLV